MRSFFRYILFLSFSYIFAQTSNNSKYYFPNFDNIGIEQGLNARSVSQMIQDHQGISWFATNTSGLISYDGYEFTNYIYEPTDSNSLANNRVTAVFEDSSKRLFIGAGNTLHYYDRIKNIFYKLNLNESYKNNSRNHLIIDIKQDGKGNIWIGTENGIFKLTFSSNGQNPFSNSKIIHYSNKGINNARNFIKSLVIDNEENIWVATKAGFGKCIFNDFSKTEDAHFDLETPIPNNAISENLFNEEAFNVVIKSNTVWVQLKDAIVEINKEKINLLKFASENIENYPARPLEEIYDDLIFLKYPFESGYVFDTEKEKFYRLPYDRHKDKSFIKFRLGSTLRTRDGIIYLGTFWGGLYKYNPYKQFVNINPSIKQIYKSENNSIRFVVETDDGNILYADRSLNKVNRTTGELIAKFENKFPNNINSILEDKNENIWIAYEENGLIKYNPKTNSVKQILSSKFINGTNPLDYKITISSMLRDESGILWCGATLKNRRTSEVKTSILKVNPNTEIVESYELFKWSNTFMESEFYFIYHIIEDENQNLWLAIGNGIVEFDKESKRTKHISIEKNNSLGLLSNKIKTVYVDPINPKKYLWIGTSDAGIGKFDRDKNHFTFYLLKDGLPSNNITSIISDQQKNLWLASDKGISKVQLNTESNPINFTNYTIFGSEEGNDFTYYYGDNAQKTKTGELIFSAPKGIVIFDPARIKSNTTIPNIFVSELRINYNSVPFNNELNLSYDENTISFLLNVIDYNEASNNKYSYMLEGYDEDWINNKNNRLAQYTKLPFGDYVFKAKGANSFGVWADDYVEARISIAPPWYRSSWAYFAYIIIFLSIMFLIVKSERHRRKLRFDYELEKIEREKLAEVDQFKSRLFANVSHEFRTPLTLINGPIDSLINGEYGSINEKAKNILTMVLRSGKRLQNLIDQILDLSRLESGKIIINKMNINVHSLIKKIESNFSAVAEKKKINWLAVDKITSQNEFLLDEDKFEKIIYNLLNNAFKFTSENGSVKLITAEDETNLIFKVIDSGIGIPEDEIDKVFDRFYQSSSNTISKSTGSGIGLAFAKELAETLGGNISVESEVEKGSTFTLTLPKKVSENSEKISVNENELQTIDGLENYEIDKPELKNEHTILLVEDDPDLLEYVNGLLSNRFKTLTAKDGVGALELLRNTNEKIDLIVSDVMMPRMDGFTFLENLKSDEKLRKIPIVMLTAKATLESKLKALRIGVHDYIFKPFSSEELLVRVTNLLHNFELRIEEPKSAKQELPAFELEWLENLENICLDKISDKILTVSYLASEMAMSESTLKRKLKELTGMAPKDYIREVKLQFARKMLEQNKVNSLAQISSQIGFGRTDYFKKLYLERFGNLPNINS